MSPASKKPPFSTTFASFFRSFFLVPPKSSQKIDMNAPFGDSGSKMIPKVSSGLPKRMSKSTKNHNKIVSEPPWAPTGDF